MRWLRILLGLSALGTGVYLIANSPNESSDSSSCPKATQDVALNTKNRNKTIKQYGYGPANPAAPNADFWYNFAKSFEMANEEPTQEDINAVKGMRCGNCVAFDVSPRMKACLPPSANVDLWDKQALESQATLGYCWMHHFKCASTRTCRTWAQGGPITKDSVSYDWQEKAKV
jgi:hypothetical protein